MLQPRRLENLVTQSSCASYILDILNIADIFSNVNIEHYRYIKKPAKMRAFQRIIWVSVILVSKPAPLFLSIVMDELVYG